MADASRPLYHSMGWRVGLDVLSRGIFFAINILIARRLGAGDFGRFGYAVSMVQMAALFADMGTSLLMLRELGRAGDAAAARWKTYLDLKLFLMLCVGGLFAVLTPVLWHWTHPWVLFAVLVWMLGNAALDAMQAACNGLGRMDIARRQVLVQRSLLLVGTVAPLLINPTLEWVAIGMALGSAAGAAASWTALHRATGVTLAWAPRWGEWRRIMVQALPNAFSGIFGGWYPRLGAVMLAWFWASEAVGEYTAAFRLLEIAYIVPTAVMSVCVPHLARAHMEGGAGFVRETRRVGALMLAGGALWALIIVPFSPVIVRLLYGAGYAGAAPVLRLFGVAGFLIYINYFVTHLMIVLGRQHRHALNQALTLAVAATLLAVLVPGAGAAGAAQALIGAEITLLALTSLSLAGALRRPGGDMLR